MIIAILLAHLVGDFILQWDSLARAKSESLKGVLFHGLIVSAVTLLFAVAFDPSWWPWAVFIGATHTLIDAIPIGLRHWRPARHQLFPLTRLVIDQLAHISIIGLALIESGYITWSSLIHDLGSALHTYRILTIVLGYAFVAMPAWIMIEFTVYALVNGTAPDFSHAIKNKYIGSLERGLIATFVLVGQFILIPIVVLPRLFFDSSSLVGNQRVTLYLAEWLASLAVAIVIGLALSRL
jgi:uncharacterized protein DUF3307